MKRLSNTLSIFLLAFTLGSGGFYFGSQKKHIDVTVIKEVASVTPELPSPIEPSPSPRPSQTVIKPTPVKQPTKKPAPKTKPKAPTVPVPEAAPIEVAPLPTTKVS